MALVALLSGAGEPSLAPIAVAGVELTERQARQVRTAGATRIFVLGGGRNYGDDAVNLDTAAMLGPRLRDDDSVLVIAAGLVVDDRILDAVMAAAATSPAVAATVIATWPAAAGRGGVERIDALNFAAGVAVYPAALVRRTALQLGDWDLSSTLLRAALCEPGCVRVDLTKLLSYGASGPGGVTYALVTTPEAVSAVTTTVLAATARSRSDAPGRYLHPAIERAVLQLLAPTRMSPPALATVIGAIGIAAAVSFVIGWLWAGLALALLFGPLQNIAERLACARGVRLRWHRWNVFTAGVAYSWWLALAVALSLERGNGGPLAVAALLGFAQVTAASEARAAYRLAGERPGSAGDAGRRIALLAANRDSLTLLLVPFAIAGQWYAGLIALAAYGVASFAATHARFLERLPSQPSP